MSYHSIEARQLSKQYMIPVSTVKKNGARVRIKDNAFWALQNMTFDIEAGEIIGIIGRNGAGKSTLLKVLSRITAPSHGLVCIRGRMASLLEVGTGFHPELTGRENIFLNGSILGMSLSEIRGRFDAIVEFSGVEQFLDTPVKHYSSGMYVRLAFSVAAHLNPEILIVDEVLAVGDIGFQARCLGKMQAVSTSGKTILIVSHNLSIIRQLCRRVLLIEKGQCIFDGQTTQGLVRYHELLQSEKIDVNSDLAERRQSHSGAVRFASLTFTDKTGSERFEFETGETLNIQFRYQAFQDVSDLMVQVGFRTLSSNDFITNSFFTLSAAPVSKGAEQLVTIEFPNVALTPREYSLYVWLGSKNGIGFDRIDYSQNGCPILTILNTKDGMLADAGYFQMPGTLKTHEV